MRSSLFLTAAALLWTWASPALSAQVDPATYQRAHDLRAEWESRQGGARLYGAERGGLATA